MLQPRHALEEAMPVPVLYFPASQFVHTLVSPVVALYVPKPQFEHALRPVSEAYVPAAHAVHIKLKAAPVAALYFPATHAVHEAEL